MHSGRKDEKRVEEPFDLYMTLLARLTSPTGLSGMWHKGIYSAKEGKKEIMLGYCCRVIASKRYSMCSILILVVIVMRMKARPRRVDVE